MRDHLSYQATFSFQKGGGSCKRGTTVTSIFNVDVVFYSYFLRKIDIV